jgi:alpha-galactosidase
MIGSYLALLALSVQAIAGNTVPSKLPRPDKTPPNTKKPIKVYLLAGQSNMVGFGTLKGGSPAYDSIFLSADPNVLATKLPFGRTAIIPHGVYQSAKEGAAKGAVVSVYKGAYDPTVDYTKAKAVKEESVALGTVSARKEVYRKEPGKEPVQQKVTLEQGKRYPVTITYLKGGSAAFWMEQVDMQPMGSLESQLKQGRFTWLADEEGNYTVRNDVIYREVRCSTAELGKGGPLTTTSNGGMIGPEVTFGHVMGAFHDEVVLVIESSIGNRALKFDYRPPSSGRTDPDNKYESYEYRALVEGTRKTLENLDKVVPGYAGQGYEIAGFAWFQGHKDGGSSKEEYEKHLVNLIKDLRKEFKVPDMKAAVATVSFHGFNLPENWKGVHAAQMAVGDPKQHPDFAGNVTSVDTRPFWRPAECSPAGVDYHYNKNGETYALVGDALGRAMVELMGGKAEDGPSPDEGAKFSDPNAAMIYGQAPLNKPDREQFEKMSPALQTILEAKVVPEFLAKALGPDSRRLRGLGLKEIVKGEQIKGGGPSIASQLDTLVGYYESVGVDDYSWKPYCPEMATAEWSYHSFEPPEKLEVGKPNRYRKVTYPKGMENWFAPDFDPKGAGWKKGVAPFGSNDGKLAPVRTGYVEVPWGGGQPSSVIRMNNCYLPLCRCDTKPKTMWEKEVLLLRQTFEVPPVKEGHAYRIVLGGAGCIRSGEGFAIYVNGKLMTEQKQGFYRDGGVRGGYVTGEALEEFKKGKVTVAVTSFLRSTFTKAAARPPNGLLSVSMQEAKVPPVAVQAAKRAGGDK